MLDSHAVRVTGGGSGMLPKYSARNWPVGQPPALTVNVKAFDTWLSGFRTVTGTEPGVAMSEAAMLAITRVPLTNVVVRAAPFHSTVVPDTKLAPSAVSVNAGDPAATVFGVSAVRLGAGGGAPVQLTC